MKLNTYLFVTLTLIILPTLISVYKYLFYINIFSIILIINGFVSTDKIVYLLALSILTLRFIFMDKSSSRGKDTNKNSIENFTGKKKYSKNDLIENGIEEFLIKDKFSELHDVIHQFQDSQKKMIK